MFQLFMCFDIISVIFYITLVKNGNLQDCVVYLQYVRVNPIIPLHLQEEEEYAGIVSHEPGQRIFTNNPLREQVALSACGGGEGRGTGSGPVEEEEEGSVHTWGIL